MTDDPNAQGDTTPETPEGDTDYDEAELPDEVKDGDIAEGEESPA